MEEGGVDLSNKRPPLIPVIVLLFCNFAFLKNFVLLETLSSTLAMDQWGWKPQLAVENMGFITMGAGGLGVLVFRFSLVNTLNLTWRSTREKWVGGWPMRF